MTFDAYEYVGVIVPGALPTLAAALLFPEVHALLGNEGVDLGGLGLFLIISFVAGHLVQALANVWEWIEDRAGWGLRTMPFAVDRGGVSDAQWQRFLQLCNRRLDIPSEGVSRETWPGIRMTIMALLPAGADRRIEVFNRSYGLCRGISAGCILTAIATLWVDPGRWGISLLLLGASLVMQARKRHFARLYLQELVARAIAWEASQVAASSNLKP